MVIKKQINEIIQGQMQKEEKQIVNVVMEKFHIAKSAKKEFFKEEFNENAFDILLDFYLGKQLGNNPKTTDVLLNNITTIIQSAISTILQVPLTIELIPGANNDEEQIKQIKDLENGLLYYWEQHLDMSKKLKELLIKMKIYGTAYLYPHYIIENKLLNLKVNIISPDSIYPDPNCIEHEEAEFIFYCAPTPLVKIQRWYPERGKFIKEEFITTSQKSFRGRSKTIVEFLSNNLNFSSPVGDTGTTVAKTKLPSANLIFGFFRDDTQEEVTVYKYSFNCCGRTFSKEDVSYENAKCPNCNELIPDKRIIKDNIYGAKKYTFPKYPYGRMIVIANDILLDDRPNPYYEFPFIKFININTTKYWGLGDVEYLMSNQIAINKLLSMGMRIIKRMAERPIISDEKAILGHVKATDYGEIIEKSPGSFVNWMDMPTLPSGLFEMYSLFTTQMDNMSGLRDRYRTKTATETTFLDEEEQRRQMTLLNDIEKELKKVVLHILHILTKYHTQTEQLALDYKKSNLVFFKGTNYQQLLFDVRIKFQTDIVQSKLMRHKQALEALQTIIPLINSNLITSEQVEPIITKLLKDLGLSQE